MDEADFLIPHASVHLAGVASADAGSATAGAPLVAAHRASIHAWNMTSIRLGTHVIYLVKAAPSVSPKSMATLGSRDIVVDTVPLPVHSHPRMLSARCAGARPVAYSPRTWYLSLHIDGYLAPFPIACTSMPWDGTRTYKGKMHDSCSSVRAVFFRSGSCCCSLSTCRTYTASRNRVYRP